MPLRLPAVQEFSARLAEFGWVTDLWVAGSLATGDYMPGVSDLDLVALVDGKVAADRAAHLTVLHRELDRDTAAGLDLGCVYVDAGRLSDVTASHPTWTHGALIERILSGVTRAELGRYGYAVLGRPPSEVLPAMSDDDVRAAAHAEVRGYWAWAARRPLMWLDPDFADLGLTSMARGRHAAATGQLLTKTAAVERAAAPAWLVDQLRARRRGAQVDSPRLHLALSAWRDARRTVSLLRHQGLDCNP